MKIFLSILAILFASTQLFAKDVNLTFSYLNTDDGSCEEIIPDVSGEFNYDDSDLIVYGRVRTGASGGDCTQESLSYTVDAEYHFELDHGWSAITKFSADKRSSSAGYAELEAGEDSPIRTRADGGAFLPITLPAGAAETVGAYLGVSRNFAVGGGNLQIDLAGNVAPVDWADAEDSRAVHIALSLDDIEVLGGAVEIDYAIDVGEDSYGDARISWTRGLLNLGVQYAFGLNAVDNGAPPKQEILGRWYGQPSAPQDTSLTTSIGVRIEL